MKREVLFRGKDIKTGEWVEGSLVITKFNAFIVPMHDETVGFQSAYSVRKDTIGQFIGFTDKNGVKIFDGDYDQNFDVIMWCERRNGWAMKTYDFPTKEVISCHCFRCEGDFDIDDVDFDIQVVGNIHD